MYYSYFLSFEDHVFCALTSTSSKISSIPVKITSCTKHIRLKFKVISCPSCFYLILICDHSWHATSFYIRVIGGRNSFPAWQKAPVNSWLPWLLWQYHTYAPVNSWFPWLLWQYHNSTIQTIQVQPHTEHDIGVRVSVSQPLVVGGLERWIRNRAQSCRGE